MDKKHTLEPTLAPTSESPSTKTTAATLHSDDVAARQEAARLMGTVTSQAKRAAVRENGKKGGRPPGSKNSPTVKEQMREAQRKRREREQSSSSNPTQSQE